MVRGSCAADVAGVVKEANGKDSGDEDCREEHT